MIFEFEVYNPNKEKSLQDTADAALQQIMDKKMQPGWKKEALKKKESAFTDLRLKEKKF